MIPMEVYNTIGQGSSAPVLVGQYPADFSTNPNLQVILNILISLFECVWLGLVLNSAGLWPSRTEVEVP